MKIIRIATFYSITLFLSLAFGSFAGWHFKVPNRKLLALADSFGPVAQWRKEEAFEKAKSVAPYFDATYFKMNWEVGALSSVLFLLLFLFLFDPRFRKFLYVKFLFMDQRQSNTPQPASFEIKKGNETQALAYSERLRLKRLELDKSFADFADSLKEI